MEDYEELRTEVRKDYYAPFYDVAKYIVEPMVKRIMSAIYFKKINPENPITWNEAHKIYWAWGQVMEHESEIRGILAECKALIGEV